MPLPGVVVVAISVIGRGGVGSPMSLDLLAPPGQQPLIQVLPDAHINISGQQVQGRAPGMIESPGHDRDGLNPHSGGFQSCHGVIGAACVAHKTHVGFPIAFSPACNLMRFIPGYGIHSDAQRQSI